MGNVQKTIRYLKRNGIKNTYYAVVERLFYKDAPFNAVKKEAPYDGPIFEDIKFSILVPVYETKKEHLTAMIDSCLDQMYTNFELILADASKTTGPKDIIDEYAKKDERVKYVRVKENKGISENTNVALDAATGDYCALLDHDDLLTPDALYEMAIKLSIARVKAIPVNMIYSDEDKTNGDNSKYFGAHIKQNLNLDLIMSNNYICHFTVIKTSLLKELKFRGEFNGSQDYDLFLRVIAASEPQNILYINKVLYHWRCHEASTAANPASKDYAYDAGRRAIESFIKEKYGCEIKVKELSHKGFYKACFDEPSKDDLFKVRKDVGAVGSLYIRGSKVATGILNEDGTETFYKMNKHFSGYMHRAHLNQDVFALDLRTVTPTPILKEYFETCMAKVNEYALKQNSKTAIDEYTKKISLEFGKKVKEMGLLFLYTYDEDGTR
ncbi:MAG: glycosyltransferase [Lachnospiraceae bacterium]|nr:glycosyltransferase [Lachnospiraceae bacterium]